MVTPHDPTDPDDATRRRVHGEPFDGVRDEKARKAASLATVLAAVAGVIALVALIYAFMHNHDFAPQNCDPATDYVCEPEVVEETATVDVPTTTMSPTEVPVPTSTPSEIVTTTVRP